VTLLELVLVMSIMALATLVMMRLFRDTLDRIETRNALHAAGHLISRARDEAIAQQTPVSVRIDTLSDRMDLFSRYGPIASEPIKLTHGASLATTRDSITFDVRGLGWGAANLTLSVRRGAAVETLTVSRLGRVKY
jgi:type II secretory pathway pseudopilin PulG